jgi:5-methylcytosine-specific restriction endonuclease McrA
MNTYIESIVSLNHPPSGASLYDPRWKKKRNEIFERDQYRCVNCKSENNLEIHLRQYHYSVSLKAFKNPWEYGNDLLITLCENCHRAGHSLYQVPVKNVE